MKTQEHLQILERRLDDLRRSLVGLTDAEIRAALPILRDELSAMHGTLMGLSNVMLYACLSSGDTCKAVH